MSTHRKDDPTTPDFIHEAERELKERLRVVLGPPTEQYARIEALIDALDFRKATGIDRGGCSWWRTD